VPNDAGVMLPEQTADLRTFGFLVQDVARLLKRHFERRARQTGLPLTRRQAAVLLHVSRGQGVSQAEIAARLDMEPIALVRMLDKLCEEGLVARCAHPTDRRVRTLVLTEEGRPMVGRILAINQQVRAEAFAGLPTQARDALIETLAAIKDNLSVGANPVDEAAASTPRHCEAQGDGAIATIYSAVGK